MADQNPGLELCEGTYRAEKLPGTVLVFAGGIHPTSGYQTFWAEDSPNRVPIQLSLWHVRPTGPVLQVITPFSVCTSFQTTHDVANVSIRDASGVHVVAVEQARAECGAGRS